MLSYEKQRASLQQTALVTLQRPDWDKIKNESVLLQKNSQIYTKASGNYSWRLFYCSDTSGKVKTTFFRELRGGVTFY